MGFQNSVNVYFNVVYFDNKMQTFKNVNPTNLHISKTLAQYGIGKYR